MNAILAARVELAEKKKEQIDAFEGRTSANLI